MFNKILVRHLVMGYPVAGGFSNPPVDPVNLRINRAHMQISLGGQVHCRNPPGFRPTRPIPAISSPWSAITSSCGPQTSSSAAKNPSGLRATDPVFKMYPRFVE